MSLFKTFTLYLIDLLRNYFHQPKILKFLTKLNLTIAFDIGSHKGETLEYFQKIKDIKKIHAFEPQTFIYKKLIKKYNSNKTIILNNIALSNNSKEKIFYINSLSSTSSFSLLNKRSFWLKIKNFILNEKNLIKNSIIIKTSTVDNYVINNNIGMIDLLKIDTEGHELEVLIGAQKTIDEKKINYILLEIHTSKMYKNYSKEKIEEFLKKNNFTLLKSFKFPFLAFKDNIYKHNVIN